MENNNEQKEFVYTYSAKEQAELKKIREKYIPKTEEENPMERLRRLDAGVTQKAGAVSLIFGVVGALVLGFGMSLCMTTLGEIFGKNTSISMAIGIIVGIIGGGLAALAYPMYNFVIKREREKIAPEIIRLSDELMR